MAHFITEACTGCTACAKLCPVFAIAGERGARHEINARRCTDCGVCARSCPVSAIVNAAGDTPAKLPRPQWPRPAIDQPKCSACQMCVQICTKDALSISLPKERGDLKVFAQLSEPKKCVGCGQCARICPLRVIKMEGGAS